MRIAIDIDSTLHQYWDLLSGVAQRRFGVPLPYEEQLTWGVTRLRPEQLALCVAETHTEALIMASRPYPGAVAVITRWHAAGHFIHITSHRTPSAHSATTRWLEGIGLPYHELYCSMDKVSRCQEIGIDLLIDDSPVNLAGALEIGIAGATILHPWNRELCDEEDIIAARDWPELERKLDALLAPAGRGAALEGRNPMDHDAARVVHRLSGRSPGGSG
ncbi:MAG TPA: hypothetical protein VGY97_00470 [Solirubrobacteraceae bacterium]|jgi:hypothetical protein|nr:hypothetical protein [Solirubrobacteraceae bacterium]